MDAGRAADDRERRAAARLRLVVAEQARSRLAILGHRLGVRGREGAVLEGEPANLKRREQVSELVGHGYAGYGDAGRVRRSRPSRPSGFIERNCKARTAEHSHLRSTQLVYMSDLTYTWSETRSDKTSRVASWRD